MGSITATLRTSGTLGRHCTLFWGHFQEPQRFFPPDFELEQVDVVHIQLVLVYYSSFLINELIKYVFGIWKVTFVRNSFYGRSLEHSHRQGSNFEA